MNVHHNLLSCPALCTGPSERADAHFDAEAVDPETGGALAAAAGQSDIHLADQRALLSRADKRAIREEAWHTAGRLLCWADRFAAGDANFQKSADMQNSADIWRRVEAKQDAYIALSDRIWGMPELNFQETRSSAEHAAMLEAEGFRVTRGLAGIPTAIMGEAGEGGPVI